MSESNTILYFIKRSTDYLSKKGIPNPRLEAEVILSHILHIPRIQLYAKFDKALSDLEKERYRELIIKRGDSIPTAYLTNIKNFYGYDFYVNENVLIPRPETEELVEKAIILVKDLHLKIKECSITRLMDLCSGSGCIGITTAMCSTDRPFRIDLVDISREALEVGKKNWEAFRKDCKADHNLQFFESDLFQDIPIEWKYHCILTNPPYILPDEESLLSLEVRREPKIALIVDNFFLFHKNLLEGCHQRLADGGFLLMETNPNQMNELLTIAKSLRFHSTSIRDISGKERFLLCYKLD